MGEFHWPFWNNLPIEQLIPRLREMRYEPTPKMRKSRSTKPRVARQLTLIAPHVDLSLPQGG